MAIWIDEIMTTLGYFGVAFLMFLENVFPPIPSELIMPLAGFSSLQPELTFWGVVLAGVIGSVVGQFPLYYLGYWFGTERLLKLADKYGRFFGVSGKDIQRAEAWFVQHGSRTVLFCRFVPGIRSLISLPAGTTKMKLTPFLAYSTLGMGIWVLALTAIGRFLGENYTLVEIYLEPISKIVFAGLGVALVVWLWRKRQSRLV